MGGQVRISKLQLIKLVEKYFQSNIDELIITEVGNKYPDGFEISKRKMLPGDVLVTKKIT